MQKRFRDAHRDRDLPRLTVHELRHTHASLLFEAGQSVKVVQERLGHASAQVTLNTYAHLLHDAQSRAADALDDLLAAPTGDSNSRSESELIYDIGFRTLRTVSEVSE